MTLLSRAKAMPLPEPDFGKTGFRAWSWPLEVAFSERQLRAAIAQTKERA